MIKYKTLDEILKIPAEGLHKERLQYYLPQGEKAAAVVCISDYRCMGNLYGRELSRAGFEVLTATTVSDILNGILPQYPETISALVFPSTAHMVHHDEGEPYTEELPGYPRDVFRFETMIRAREIINDRQEKPPKLYIEKTLIYSSLFPDLSEGAFAKRQMEKGKDYDVFSDSDLPELIEKMKNTPPLFKFYPSKE